MTTERVVSGWEGASVRCNAEECVRASGCEGRSEPRPRGEATHLGEHGGMHDVGAEKLKNRQPQAVAREVVPHAGVVERLVAGLVLQLRSSVVAASVSESWHKAENPCMIQVRWEIR
jgi:hypothetical protein